MNGASSSDMRFASFLPTHSGSSWGARWEPIRIGLRLLAVTIDELAAEPVEAAIGTLGHWLRRTCPGTLVRHLIGSGWIWSV